MPACSGGQAASRADRAEKSLEGAADSAGKLVFALSEESRKLGGATSEGSKVILDQAQKLQAALIAAGPFDPSVLQAQADGLMTSAEALFKQGNLPESLDRAGSRTKNIHDLCQPRGRIRPNGRSG